jgi:hypothetical protein
MPGGQTHQAVEFVNYNIIEWVGKETTVERLVRWNACAIVEDASVKRIDDNKKEWWLGGWLGGYEKINE